MTYKVRVLSQFESDVDEIYDWYIKEGGEQLVLTFIDKMLEAIQHIEHSPLSFQKYRNNIRKINLDVFPYKILYKLHLDEVIIIAIFHSKRKGQKFWKRKMK